MARKPSACLLVALVAVLCYSNSLDGGIFLDNEPVLLRDARIHHSSGAAEILSTQYWHGFTTSTLFRPLTTLSYWFNYTVLGHGAEPRGYHVVNTALHAITAVLVMLLWSRLGVTTSVCIAAGCLFAAHPVATEAVANIVGRADILATLFVVAGLLADLRARRSGTPWRWRGLCGVFYFLAMASKESGFVLIALLLVTTFLFGNANARESTAGGNGRSPRRWLLDLAAPGTALLAMLAWRWAVVAEIDAPEVDFVDNPLVLGSGLERLATAIKVIGMYALRLLAPATLSADYSYSQIQLVSSLADLGLLAGLIVVGTFAVAIAVYARRRPLLAFALLFMVIAFAPVSNLLILIGTIMAERLLYMPLVGFSLVAATFLVGIARRVAPGRQGLSVAVAISLVTVLYGARTLARNRDWKDEVRFWEVTARASPNSTRALNGYSKSVHRSHPNQPGRALEIQRRILEFAPESPRGRARLAEYLILVAENEVQRGDHEAAARSLDEAHQHLQAAAESDQDFAARWAARHPESHRRIETVTTEPLVWQTRLSWCRARSAYYRAQGSEPPDQDLQLLETALKKLVLTHPREGDNALFLADLFVAQGRPQAALGALIISIGGAAGPASTAGSRLAEVYRKAGLIPQRFIKAGPGIRLDLHAGEDDKAARKNREMVLRAWRTYVKVYLARGDRDTARATVATAEAQGLSAADFEDLFESVPDPSTVEFWE